MKMLFQALLLALLLTTVHAKEVSFGNPPGK